MLDVIIIGGGPSGISAGIYAKRSGLDVMIIEKSVVGGQVINTYEVKNFPTYNNISGADFCLKLYEQALYNEIEIKNEEVESVNLLGEIKTVKTNSACYQAKTVIICAGGKPRNLGLENEMNFVGKGISYCALCDGNFFKDKTVCVVGGGDSAMEDAIYLGGICKKVYVINRTQKLRAQAILQNSLNEHIKNEGKIEVVYDAQITKLFGENLLEKVEISFSDGRKEEKNIDGLFLAIGKDPDTKIYAGQIELNKNGYILVDKNFQTSAKGVFAGGDCIEKLIRQIITACSDGALCATHANNYIKGVE